MCIVHPHTHTHMSVLGLNDSVATATGGPVGHVFLCVEKGFRGILGDGRSVVYTNVYNTWSQRYPADGNVRLRHCCDSVYYYYYYYTTKLIPPRRSYSYAFDTFTSVYDVLLFYTVLHREPCKGVS